MGVWGVEQGRLLDVNGLTHIRDFRWIRPQELALLMWPKNKRETAINFAESLARKWRAKGYVIARKLPEHAGTALTLSAKGAEFLGGGAKTGKDWGNTAAGGIWTPPKTWEHDLIAHGVLTWFAHGGAFEVTPEHKIRQQMRLEKYPDGLLIHKETGNGYVLEVENTRKTGQSHRDLVEAVVRASAGYNLNDVRIVGAALAFEPRQLDERGYAVDHEERLKKSIAKVIKQNTTVGFAQISMRGFGVGSVAWEWKIVAPDLAGQRIARWQREGKWINSGGQQWVRDGQHYGTVEETGTGFSWRIYSDFGDLMRMHESSFGFIDETKGDLVASGKAPSRSSAQEAMAAEPAWHNDFFE